MGLVSSDGKTMLAGGTLNADGTKRRNRVKALRLRGTLSQGLVYSHTDKLGELVEGADYTEQLGIEKYVPPVPTEMSGKVEHAPELRSYTDIENIKNFPGVLTPGEEVACAEKIHGCLHATTNILLPDFTRRSIRDLVLENYSGDVLGVDENGRVVATPVLKVFDNGVTDGWIRIQCERRRAGKGKPTISVTATSNHRFYCPASSSADGAGYVRADQLRVGDRITSMRYDAGLPPLAEQVLLGKMLGDGSLCHNRQNTTTARVEFGHTEAPREYVTWTLDCLGDFANPRLGKRISGYGSNIVCAKTVTLPSIAEFLDDWHDNGRKEVPESVIDRIGPIALAFWYMDDGGLSHHEDQEDRAELATNSFSPAFYRSTPGRPEQVWHWKLGPEQRRAQAASKRRRR